MKIFTCNRAQYTVLSDHSNAMNNKCNYNCDVIGKAEAIQSLRVVNSSSPSGTKDGKTVMPCYIIK